jgi:hypothetical protein
VGLALDLLADVLGAEVIAVGPAGSPPAACPEAFPINQLGSFPRDWQVPDLEDQIRGQLPGRPAHRDRRLATDTKWNIS